MNRIQPLEDKILQFLALGTQVGILIDPDEETVTIYYRDNCPKVVLGNDAIAIPELLPAWEVPLESRSASRVRLKRAYQITFTEY